MTKADGTGRVAELVERFTRAHFEAHPEDASSLGAKGHGARLSVPSRAAAEGDLAWLRAALALDLDTALDLDAVSRAGRFRE